MKEGGERGGELQSEGEERMGRGEMTMRHAGGKSRRVASH